MISKLVLARTGSNYLLKGESASLAASLLRLPKAATTAPSLKFPINSLDTHLRTLVLKHKLTVAIQEEFRQLSSSGKSLKIDRRIVRVVTPSSFHSPFASSLLVAAVPSSDNNNNGVALVSLDLDSGHSSTFISSYFSLSDDIYRINPSHLLLPTSLEQKEQHPLFTALKLKDPPYLISFVDDSSIDCSANPAQQALSLINIHTQQENNNRQSPSTNNVESNIMPIDAHTLRALEITSRSTNTKLGGGSLNKNSNPPAGGGGGGHLLSAVDNTLTSSGHRLLLTRLSFPSTSLHTIRHRQALVAALYNHPHLLHLVKNALSVLRDPANVLHSIIQGRGPVSNLLDLADFINAIKTLQTQAQQYLLDNSNSNSNNNNNINDQDLTTFQNLIKQLCDNSSLAKSLYSAVQQSVRQPTEFDDIVEASSEHRKRRHTKCSNDDDDSRGASSDLHKDKWFMSPSFSPHLRNAHATLAKAYRAVNALQTHLATKYNIPSKSLQLKYLRGKLPIVHIRTLKAAQNIEEEETKKENDNENGNEHGNGNVKIGIQVIRSTSRTRQYIHPEWTELSDQITSLRRNLKMLERQTHHTLIQQIYNDSYNQLYTNCKIADELDVAYSFAITALKFNYTRPTLDDDSTNLVIVGGRHPSIEQRLALKNSDIGIDTDTDTDDIAAIKPKSFVPNSIHMIKNDSNVHIVTGPNMGGKSTFLRMIAQIVLLAQAGSYVPATQAHIGIVDQIFIRMGSSDSLFQGRSSFMVEMLETVDILDRFTPKSLLLMDEIGRASSGDDGTSLAFATIQSVLTKQARAVFATHFHNLVPLLGYKQHSKGLIQPARHLAKGVTFSATDLAPSKINPNIDEYTYKIRPGVTWTSDGIKVAKLAKMPDDLLDVARIALNDVNAVHDREHDALVNHQS